MKKSISTISVLIFILLLNACGGATASSSDSGDNTIAPTQQSDTVDTGSTPSPSSTSSGSTDTSAWNIVGDPTSALAVSALNKIRSDAGLTTLKTNYLLEQSAQNHANYVWDVYLNYRVNAIHYEYEDKYPSEYYTGQLKERIQKVYSENGVQMSSSPYSENITLETNSNASYTKSLNWLMSAIYHRFGFLDKSLIEVGISNSGGVWNYNMASNSSQRLKNPSIVIYPYSGQKQVQRYYNNAESPDPLYGKGIVRSVGYPISIEFASSTSVSSFKLYEVASDGTKTEITNVLMMDKSNDPNNMFNSSQFALFPLDVLKANTTYRAEVVYSGGVKNWEFVTVL